MRVQRRAVAGQVQRRRPAEAWSAPAARPWGCRPAPGRAGRSRRCGTPPAITRGMSSASCDQVVVLGDRQRDAADVGFLEGVGADDGRGHLAGDRDDRHRVHVRVGDRRDQVGRARAGGGHADADLAGGLRVPLGGVAGALLVADQDVPDRGGVEQRVVRRAGSRRRGCRRRRRPRPPRASAPGPALRSIGSVCHERGPSTWGGSGRGRGKRTPRAWGTEGVSAAAGAGQQSRWGTTRIRAGAHELRTVVRRRRPPSTRHPTRWDRRLASRPSLTHNHMGI